MFSVLTTIVDVYLSVLMISCQAIACVLYLGIYTVHTVQYSNTTTNNNICRWDPCRKTTKRQEETMCSTGSARLLHAVFFNSLQDVVFFSHKCTVFCYYLQHVAIFTHGLICKLWQYTVRAIRFLKF